MKTHTIKLLSTETQTSALIVRLSLAFILFAHGAQSMLGWFGGSGFSNTMAYLTTVEKLPSVLAFCVIALQFFGAIMLALGALVRPVALAVSAMFFGMIVTVHFSHGFFMNWFGNQNGEGYEYHILVIALGLSALLQGAGRLSFDRYLLTKLKTQ